VVLMFRSVELFNKYTILQHGSFLVCSPFEKVLVRMKHYILVQHRQQKYALLHFPLHAWRGHCELNALLPTESFSFRSSWTRFPNHQVTMANSGLLFFVKLPVSELHCIFTWLGFALMIDLPFGTVEN